MINLDIFQLTMLLWMIYMNLIVYEKLLDISILKDIVKKLLIYKNEVDKKLI